MLTIRDVEIPAIVLGKTFLLTEITPAYKYENGERTDEIVGYKYLIALPKHNFKKLSVKIAGKQLVQLDNNYVEVEFDELKLVSYNKQGVTMLAGTATNIKVINTKN